MKTIGIIGGLGPETTVIYYRLLMAAGHTRVLINSVESGVLVPMVLAQDGRAVAEFLSVEIERLAEAGADVGLLAANTPHKWFEDIQSRSRLPLVSIVEATAARVAARGLRRVALFGTRVTVEASFYPDALRRRGVETVLPNDEERTYIHEKYMGELFKNDIRPQTRRGLLSIVETMAARSAIDAVILGGTELSLILTDEAHNGIPLVDTTRIHVEAVLEHLGRLSGDV